MNTKPRKYRIRAFQPDQQRTLLSARNGIQTTHHQQFSEQTTSELRTLSELREAINRNPEEFFLLRKIFAPTEESSKDSIEAAKSVKSIFQLGNPAAETTPRGYTRL